MTFRYKGNNIGFTNGNTIVRLLPLIFSNLRTSSTNCASVIFEHPLPTVLPLSYPTSSYDNWSFLVLKQLGMTMVSVLHGQQWLESLRNLHVLRLRNLEQWSKLLWKKFPSLETLFQLLTKCNGWIYDSWLPMKDCACEIRIEGWWKPQWEKIPSLESLY